MNCSESLIVLNNKILKSDGVVKAEGSEKQSNQALEFLPVNAKLSKGWSCAQTASSHGLHPQTAAQTAALGGKELCIVLAISWFCKYEGDSI